MERPSTLLRPRSRPVGDPATAVPAVTDESLVVRNYDARPVRLHVRFLDANDETAFERTYALGPGDVVSTPARLKRGVYRVVARLVAVGETDAGADTAADAVGRDAAECLVGSAPAETAVVETGNGVVSVAEGVV